MRKIVTIVCMVALILAAVGIPGMSLAADQGSGAGYQSAAQASTELSFTIGSKDYYVGKIKKALSAAPLTKDARTLIPIRYVVEAIGGTINWTQETQETSITVGSTNIVMTVGKATALVNGVEKPIDASNTKVMPLNMNGRIFIPLRFVSETINAEVIWNPYTKTVTIRYPKPEPVTFSNSLFSFSYPSNWEKPDKSVALFVSPEGCSISVLSSALTASEKKMTLSELVKSAEPGLREVYSDLKAGKQIKQNVSGLDGIKVTYTGSREDIPMTFTIVYVVKNGNMFVLTLGGATGVYPSYTTTFDNTIKSFTIK
jgi:hypothetical protein